MQRSWNIQEIIGALVLILLGVGTMIYALQYDLGTARRIGAGLFPLAQGIVLAGLGMLILVQECRSDTPPIPVEMRPLLMIFAGFVAWILLLPRFGYVPATFALAALCAMADRNMRPLRLLIFSSVMVLAGYLIFIRMLAIPVDLVRY